MGVTESPASGKAHFPYYKNATAIVPAKMIRRYTTAISSVSPSTCIMRRIAGLKLIPITVIKSDTPITIYIAVIMLFSHFYNLCPDKLGNNDTHSGRQAIYQHQGAHSKPYLPYLRAHCCISDKIADNQRIRHIIKALQNQGTCDRQRKHQQFFVGFPLRKIPDSFFFFPTAILTSS